MPKPAAQWHGKFRRLCNSPGEAWQLTRDSSFGLATAEDFHEDCFNRRRASGRGRNTCAAARPLLENSLISFQGSSLGQVDIKTTGKTVASSTRSLRTQGRSVRNSRRPSSQSPEGSLITAPVSENEGVVPTGFTVHSGGMRPYSQYKFSDKYNGT